MTLDYQKVAELLALQQVLNTPAEVHGMICGQLGSGKRPYNPGLTCQLMALTEEPEVIRQLLTGLAESVVEQMEGGGFDFEALLPADDEDLGLRTHALGRWCDGYNLGFAAGLSAAHQEIDPAIREVLADFARIAEIDTADDDEDDAQEEDYMQVVEYIRVAATTVYLQQREPDAGHSEPPSYQ